MPDVVRFLDGLSCRLHARLGVREAHRTTLAKYVPPPPWPSRPAPFSPGRPRPVSTHFPGHAGRSCVHWGTPPVPLPLPHATPDCRASFGARSQHSFPFPFPCETGKQLEQGLKTLTTAISTFAVISVRPLFLWSACVHRGKRLLPSLTSPFHRCCVHWGSAYFSAKRRMVWSKLQDLCAKRHVGGRRLGLTTRQVVF